MFCMFCGQKLPAGAEYCKRCCIPPKEEAPVERKASFDEPEERATLFGAGPDGSGEVLPQREDSASRYMVQSASAAAAAAGTSGISAFSPARLREADGPAETSPFKPLKTEEETEEQEKAPETTSRPSPFKTVNRPQTETRREPAVNNPFVPLSSRIAEEEPEPEPAPEPDPEPAAEPAAESSPFKPLGGATPSSRPSPFKTLS